MTICGDPDSRPLTLFLNSQYKINDAIDWYAFANYGAGLIAMTASIDHMPGEEVDVVQALPVYGREFQASNVDDQGGVLCHIRESENYLLQIL